MQVAALVSGAPTAPTRAAMDASKTVPKIQEDAGPVDPIDGDPPVPRPAANPVRLPPVNETPGDVRVVNPEDGDTNVIRFAPSIVDPLAIRSPGIASNVNQALMDPFANGGVRAVLPVTDKLAVALFYEAYVWISMAYVRST